ncbi:cell wall-binding repeat-containing protein [Miniphocaeibacter halophilus]|uniref:Cell wall-binding repeat-containing protein n=1 Tax=Miniphocaeibacter halophilus TaxID=2931922 RepID=A0AC61MYB1_9FIRM|nr:cell wall-binding repeat-containing protein [Miniphocaeibacter halophilus]QQK08223.1 cell wall-binding repeat-containing protein [Miniphocaeibacter halophilus]
MLRTKRITSFLLAFVMVFSIFVGTTSKAQNDNNDSVTVQDQDAQKGQETTPVLEDAENTGDSDDDTNVPAEPKPEEVKFKAEINSLKVDDEEKENLTESQIEVYGLQLKKINSEDTVDFNTEETMEKVKKYKVVVDDGYNIKSITIKNGEESVKLESDLSFTTPETGNKLVFDIVLESVGTVTTTVTSLKVDDKEPITTATELTAAKLKEYGLKLKRNETELDFPSDTNKLVNELEYEVISSKYDIEEVKFGTGDNRETATDNKFTVPNDATALNFDITLKTKVVADKVTRLEGTDRYETAVEIAKEAYPTAKNVIIANGEVSADALAAGPLANELEAPILLVRDNSAIQGVKNYIRDNGVEKIYVVGGRNSVSENLVRELQAVKEGVTTSRIDGKDRYETSIKVATTLKDKGYTNGVIIANGTDAKDADALAASTYATEKKMPIVLTNGSVLTTEVKAGLKTIGATKATIIGGPQTVAENIINGTALTYTSEGRISGVNRFETSVAIAEKLTQANVKTVVVANGYKSPDALTAGPLAFTKNAAIILSTETDFTSSQNTYIGTIKNIETAYIAGGVNSVKPAVKTALETLVENSRDK